jgi:hypothetical protein
MIPLIPIVALMAILGGGVTLMWYDNLSEEEKENADRIAGGYAKQLYNASLENLTDEQAKRVAALTQRHFNN